MSKIIFEKFISLGSFCSPALWIKELGLRNCSYPLDWVLTPQLRRTNDLIENNFIDFLEIKHLVAMDELKSITLNMQNTKYNIRFVHDFSKDIAVENQLSDVKAKYDRRINRFYETLHSGKILFIRYVTRSGFDEAPEIDRLIGILKSYNDDFKLILVKNTDSPLGTIKNKDFILKIFDVEKDEGNVFKRGLPDELKDYLDQHIEFVLRD